MGDTRKKCTHNDLKEKEKTMVIRKISKEKEMRKSRAQ